MPDENGNLLPGDPRHDVILGRAIPGGAGAVAIGDSPWAPPGDAAVQIGTGAEASALLAVAIGGGAAARAEGAINIGGNGGYVEFPHATQIGAGMSPTADYQAIINADEIQFRRNHDAGGTTIVLQSPNMTLWRLHISDAGVLSVTAV